MPGRRHLATERAAHDQPSTFARIHHDLRSQLPDLDRALVGHQAILAELHRLGLRRPNGRPLSWRMVLRWRREFGCPIAHGLWHSRYLAPPLSTSFALTSWMLSQFSTGERFGYRVDTTRPPTDGTFAPTDAVQHAA